jgi:hypothetical protein
MAALSLAFGGLLIHNFILLCKVNVEIALVRINRKSDKSQINTQTNVQVGK